jgi:hypothetical protein
MSGRPRKAAFLGPAAVTVRDDRYMLRQGSLFNGSQQLLFVTPVVVFPANDALNGFYHGSFLRKNPINYIAV